MDEHAKLAGIEKLLEDGLVEEAFEATMELDTPTRDLALLMLVEWGCNCAEQIENEYYRSVAMAVLYERGEVEEDDIEDIRVRSAAMKRVAVRECDVGLAARISIPYYRALAFMEISEKTGRDFSQQIESAINWIENPYLRKWIEERYKRFKRKL